MPSNKPQRVSMKSRILMAIKNAFKVSREWKIATLILGIALVTQTIIIVTALRGLMSERCEPGSGAVEVGSGQLTGTTGTAY